VGAGVGGGGLVTITVRILLDELRPSLKLIPMLNVPTSAVTEGENVKVVPDNTTNEGYDEIVIVIL
jgi:hypothetical protein